MSVPPPTGLAPPEATNPKRPPARRRRKVRDPRLHLATHALRDWRPEWSAAEPVWPAQKVAILLTAAMLGAALVLLGDNIGTAISWLLALPFLASAIVRIGALRHILRLPRRMKKRPLEPVPDASLPSYTVMVPLFREAAVVPQIVEALLALDYPTDRLQVLLVVEAIDPDTQAAFHHIPLPSHMRVVVVPPGEPKTKPRAINYALFEATGDYVVVYDAEDIPEPDQLRRAAARFARDPELGCLQARLNIYNANEAWLTRGIA